MIEKIGTCFVVTVNGVTTKVVFDRSYIPVNGESLTEVPMGELYEVTPFPYDGGIVFASQGDANNYVSNMGEAAYHSISQTWVFREREPTQKKWSIKARRK